MSEENSQDYVPEMKDIVPDQISPEAETVSSEFVAADSVGVGIDIYEDTIDVQNSSNTNEFEMMLEVGPSDVQETRVTDTESNHDQNHGKKVRIWQDQEEMDENELLLQEDMDDKSVTSEESLGIDILIQNTALL
jgi:hypothetical protein